MSFPTRERGLKFPYDITIVDRQIVVPHAGTWIEILETSLKLHFFPSFPTRERGLKCFLYWKK